MVASGSPNISEISSLVIHTSLRGIDTLPPSVILMILLLFIAVYYLRVIRLTVSLFLSLTRSAYIWVVATFLWVIILDMV